MFKQVLIGICFLITIPFFGQKKSATPVKKSAAVPTKTTVAQTKPNWQHFDADIFTRAKKENKLVLLHLRANWCHWCHVMEEKTYADKKVIAYLNKNYIACTEDHDERQDLTSLYNDYGWPATIIFDSNGNELLKEPGYISAEEFLPSLMKLRKNPKKMESDFVSTDPRSQNETAIKASLQTVNDRFRNSLDFQGGGFVFGQKYIEFDTFEYALSHFRSDSLSQWIRNSIVNSAGIYDKAWGGVFQYSTHNDWDHVHYEKLLFIQARYMKMYCWYFKLFGDSSALKQAEGIAKYVDRFLKAPNGGYYNAQDADLIKGEKSHEYFALSDAERIKKGIPDIDSNVYTSDNAQYCEALTILWAASGKEKYLTAALNCTDFLMSTRKTNTAYMHGSKYASTVSLKDNIWMAQNLLMQYRATQKEVYKNEAGKILQNVINTFPSGQGYFYTYVGKSAIKSSYNISENIQACRVLNYASHVFSNPDHKTKATEIFNFLTNEKVIDNMSTEPGILSASEEIKTEPITAALMIKKGEALRSDYIPSCVSIPHFYFNAAIYNKETVIADKKDLFDSFDENFTVLCTSSYCSSPMFNSKDFLDFLYKRVLDAK